MLADGARAAGRRAGRCAAPSRAGAARRRVLGRQAARRAAGRALVGARATRSRRAARHPLARALRIDKLSLAALEATLALYRDPARARREIPVLAMLDAGRGELRARARERAGATAGGGDGRSTRSARVGGGALPLLELPGPAVALDPAGGGRGRAGRARCARGDPPVVGRIEDGRLLLDPRTLADAEATSPRAAAARGRAARRRPARRRRSTLGTAGHIDHGKTALVRALTGVDTDRLPEEQRARHLDRRSATRRSSCRRRGGCASSTCRATSASCATMVAGATGIDLFLLVVAADDGVMPQTREHVAVLRGLGVSARRRRASRRPTSPIPAARPREAADAAGRPGRRSRGRCSARTGAGLDGAGSRRSSASRRRRRPRAAAAGRRVLHVDRVVHRRAAPGRS